MSLVFVNGKPQSTVSALDRGLLYGDGLFETVAIVNGKPLLLKQHLCRLEQGVQRLGFNTDLATLQGEIKECITQLNQSTQSQENVVLRITITRGEYSRGYAPLENSISTRILSIHDWPTSVPESVRLSKSSVKYAHQPLLAGLKHSNRLEQVLAAQSIPEGFEDVVMLDKDDFVISCSKGNLFLKLDGVWTTPSLDKCGIKGVVRGEVINWFEQQDIPLQEVDISAIKIEENPHKLEGAFMCNSVVGVIPVDEFMGISSVSNKDSSDFIQSLSKQMISSEFVAKGVSQ